MERLESNGMTREDQYPDWLANVMVVRKKNGKPRLWIDFTNFNKACPKDSFPHLIIDTVVDATARHELICSLDAYFGDNQILMHPDDQEKTSLMT